MSHLLNPQCRSPELLTVLTVLDFMAAERANYQRLCASHQSAAAFAAWNNLECYRLMAQQLLMNMDTRSADVQTLRALHLQYDQLCTIDKSVARAHARQQDWNGCAQRALDEYEALDQ